jgi:mannosyltransferase
MIRVLPQRPGWTAVLVGETTPEFQAFERRLRGKIKNAGLTDRFHFTGFLKRFEDIPDWYRVLSVVVCPSRTEGFGLSCLEAMASGCPVVATCTGAWPELISDGIDGYLVPCADADALAEAIAKITENPMLADWMGQQARQKVAGHYQIENEADGIYAVYRTLLGKHGIVI